MATPILRVPAVAGTRALLAVSSAWLVLMATIFVLAAIGVDDAKLLLILGIRVPIWILGVGLPIKVLVTWRRHAPMDAVLADEWQRDDGAGAPRPLAPAEAGAARPLVEQAPAEVARAFGGGAPPLATSPRVGVGYREAARVEAPVVRSSKRSLERSTAAHARAILVRVAWAPCFFLAFASIPLVYLVVAHRLEPMNFALLFASTIFALFAVFFVAARELARRHTLTALALRDAWERGVPVEAAAVPKISERRRAFVHGACAALAIASGALAVGAWGGSFLTFSELSRAERQCEEDDVASACTRAGELFGDGDAASPLQRSYYQRGCDLGDAQGCYRLGAILDDHTWSQEDMRASIALLDRACERGVMAACNDLGYAYAHGLGATTDLPRSAALYDRACRGGHSLGCANLGVAYDNGRGVAQDKARAAQLYDQACRAREDVACNNLGLLYERGEGVPKDAARAAALYDQACDLESGLACNNLAVLYDSGNGVPRDPARATRLRARACAHGFSAACRR